MGGNALKQVQTKRLERADFERLTQRIVSVLNKAIAEANLQGLNITDAPYEVKAYRQKETFGDLDLLVDERLFSVYKYEQMMSDVAAAFNYTPKEPFVTERGEETFYSQLPFKYKEERDIVFSFGVPDEHDQSVFFQVDLIATHPDIFSFHSSYLNWNDLGNLVGVVASKTKFLKYGHNGLRYLFKDGDNQFHEAVLTLDWDEALRFMGYEPARYHEGFDNLEEVYAYASSSKYFDPVLYAFENRNHIQRTRDRKRPTYNGFLNYIQEHEQKGAFAHTHKRTPEEWKAAIYDFFPHFADEEAKAWDKLARRKVFKQYFLGGVLLKYKPELKNEAISNYLKELHTVVPDLESFVLEHRENAMPLLIELKENLSK